MLAQPCHFDYFAAMHTQCVPLFIIQFHCASLFSSFSRAPLSCASSSVGCAWEQTEFVLLALSCAILPFLQQNGREELHCIGHGFVGPSEKKRWGILASWWATVSMKGVESIVDRLQPLSEISFGEESGWWVRREQSVSLKHHWVYVL